MIIDCPLEQPFSRSFPSPVHGLPQRHDSHRANFEQKSVSTSDYSTVGSQATGPRTGAKIAMGIRTRRRTVSTCRKTIEA